MSTFSLNIQHVPLHLISGFLGAGKTTVLRHLLQQKPMSETWAVLVNEFGEIGLDQAWLGEIISTGLHQDQSNGIAIHEVLGGCLCCVSQLPMQIGLARLLSEHKPDRLFIETTGLGHADTLLQQLAAPHWQRSLSVRQPITVVDGSRLHQRLWEQNDIYLRQIDAAEIILISHASDMQHEDKHQLCELQQVTDQLFKTWIQIDHGQVDLATVDQSYTPTQVHKQNLLSVTSPIPAHVHLEHEAPKTLPYHYHHYRQGYSVAGWRLPRQWQFNADRLTELLYTLTDTARIKAKLNTEEGWINVNVVQGQFHIDASPSTGLDNRLEIITQTEQNWSDFEHRWFTESRIC